MNLIDIIKDFDSEHRTETEILFNYAEDPVIVIRIREIILDKMITESIPNPYPIIINWDGAYTCNLMTDEISKKMDELYSKMINKGE